MRMLINTVKVGRIRAQIEAPRSEDQIHQIRTEPADFVHTP